MSPQGGVAGTPSPSVAAITRVLRCVIRNSRPHRGVPVVLRGKCACSRVHLFTSTHVALLILDFTATLLTLMYGRCCVAVYPIRL